MNRTADRSETAPGETAAPWVPIVRPALQEEIVVRIRQMIEDGLLLPGSRIPERQLCAQLGVSRTPLREAFRILASQGLLELTPRRGATVKKLQADEINHMFQVLEVLEALAGELACGVMSDGELRRIEELHERMMAAYRRRDRRRFFEINQLIHESIVAASGNPVLERVYEGLNGLARRIRYLPQITETQWRVAAQEHEAIMKALKARNRQALGRVLRTHLRTKRERVKGLLAG
ncbi:MAG TPA: GntR family transcriptional regulator [Usitatibacter sp.]|nr:GntR family transcriptional regulator [Usitatibacter sp.]